jgi:thioredoxin-like negative regulator of GroEL
MRPVKRAQSASRLPALVFVRRRQCGSSRKMESLVAWVKVTRKRKLRVAELDADEHPELVRRLGVEEVPALLLTVDGRVVGKLEGRSTGRQIDELIRRHVPDRPEGEPPAAPRPPPVRRVRPGRVARGARPGTAGT